MCGIAGFNLAPEENVNATRLASELLLGIEERGRHATGVAYFDGDGAWVQKDALPATAFVKDLDMPAHTSNALLHTRFGTKGSRHDMANNHPIEIPGHVIGVHNGVVWNDDEIFAEVGTSRRIAEVDSEAIFAALAYLPGPIDYALGKVLGSAAIAWIDTLGDPGTMHLARISASPLIFAFTEGGSFIFASTASAIRRATTKAGLTLGGAPFTLGEQHYLRVCNGQVVDKRMFVSEVGRSGAPLTEIERAALNL